MNANKIRVGYKVLIDNDPYIVLTYTLRPSARGLAKVIIKVKNLLTGSVTEKTFIANDKVSEADVTSSRAEFLYKDKNDYIFMDHDTYEQCEFSSEKIGDLSNFLVEGVEVSVVKFNENPINIELPPTVKLEVTEAEPGVKGDTAGSASKTVKLSTGLSLQAPLFIETGNFIIVNTMNGAYKERAKD